LQKQNELSALAFACKYSLITNRLDYCGKKNSFESFGFFLANPSEEKAPEIKSLLDSFYSEKSYSESIASVHNLERFDFSVLEAYWLGNNLLEKGSHREIQKTILGFQNFGLPREIAEQKAVSLPENCVPHHSLHVLHVNFITPKLKPLVKNLSDCLIQWGEVKGAEKEKIKVKGIELKSLNNRLVLQEKSKLIENPFSLLPEKGDFVSCHWNNAIEILSEEQLESLKKYTLRNLEAVNSIR